MPALTDIFGTHINVTPQGRRRDKQKTGFAGAHGMTGMNLGSRGRPIVVTGTLYAAGASYALARAALLAAINVIDAYQDLSDDTYTYQSETYYYTTFESPVMIQPGPAGRGIYYNGSQAFCRFQCLLYEHV